MTNTPAPEAFIHDLLYGQDDRPGEQHGLWRPPLDRAFALRVDPPLDPAFVFAVLQEAVVGLTGGRVGFVFDRSRPAEAIFRLDPSDRYAKAAIAVTYQHQTAGLITGFEVVYGMADWLDSPKVIAHEAGHGLGLCHAYREKWGDRFVMGNAPRDQRAFDPWEREAWLRAASIPAGTPRPGSRALAAPATHVVCGPEHL